MKKFFSLCLMFYASFMTLSAQDFINVHHRYGGVSWKTPFKQDALTEFDFTPDGKTLNGYLLREEKEAFKIPFNVETLDSIGFANDLLDEEKGHNKYRSFVMNIVTENQASLLTKEEWVNCVISIDGKGEYSDYSGTARIRGRGNSSWEWYDKKPYKFKLDEKSKILGLSKAKNWNLLANYRDVGDMMNTYAFEVARLMKMPNTNHTRFLEVFLNGEYIGLYQLTEKIEVGKNRVEIDEEGGVMLSFDQDDGPSLSPGATDNFWSKVYNLPMCVKYPEDPSAEKLDSIRMDFAVLENAIKQHDYHLVDSLLDIKSFIGILQLHEYLYNVEIDAPRSIYMYKDKGGKYVFGPVWDWDAGYDFDWGNMYTGHTFFSDYKELIYGTNPVKQNGAYKISKFFIDMFNNRQFVSEYKDAWTAISDTIYTNTWAETQKYVDELNKGAYKREFARWPMSETSSNWWDTSKKNFTASEELSKMSKWLKNRKAYLDEVIADYPLPAEDTGVKKDTVLAGTINMDVKCSYDGGYSQSGKITIDEKTLKEYLGNYSKSTLMLIPLNPDGTEGQNTAAGTYGAWFGESGATAAWAYGHVYVESNNLFSWSYGCHPDNCYYGDRHTVTMRYINPDGAVVKVVDVCLKFIVE